MCLSTEIRLAPRLTSVRCTAHAAFPSCFPRSFAEQSPCFCLTLGGHPYGELRKGGGLTFLPG